MSTKEIKCEFLFNLICYKSTVYFLYPGTLHPKSSIIFYIKAKLSNNFYIT